MSLPVVRRFTAHNAATASENPIHSDEVARRHGFGGALVPGVTLYGQLTVPVVEHFGREWLERGTVDVRFEAPVYDGAEVTVGAAERADGQLDLELRDPRGRVCVSGRAGLAPREAPPDPEAIPAWPAPARRPAADEVTLAPGRVLTTVWSGPDPDASAPYVALVPELPLYREERWRPPGELILAANRLLTASVALDAWVHVGSEVRNFSPVPRQCVVETRARVADNFARSGHRFVVLDVVWLVDGSVVITAGHTAIYRLRTAGVPPGPSATRG